MESHQGAFIMHPFRVANVNSSTGEKQIVLKGHRLRLGRRGIPLFTSA